MKRLLLLLVLISGCVRPKTILAPTIEGRGWAARADSTTQFTVIAIDAEGERAAMEKLCSASYVCQIGPPGKVFIVERTRK